MAREMLEIAAEGHRLAELLFPDAIIFATLVHFVVKLEAQRDPIRHYALRTFVVRHGAPRSHDRLLRRRIGPGDLILLRRKRKRFAVLWHN